MTGGTKHEPVIMAGSLDKSTAQQVPAAEDPWLQNDPWSKMKAQTGTNVMMRSTPAPTATAISAQDQKLQKMQEQLDGIAGRLQGWTAEDRDQGLSLSPGDHVAGSFAETIRSAHGGNVGAPCTATAAVTIP